MVSGERERERERERECVCERVAMIQVCCTFQVVAAEGSRSSDYVYLNWIVQWSLVLSTCFAFDEFLPIIIRLPQRSVDLHPVGYTEQPNIKKTKPEAFDGHS